MKRLDGTTPGLSLKRFKVDARSRADGSVLVASREPLGEVPRRVVDPVLAWAAHDPDRLALSDRHGPPGEWRSLTYGELRDRTAGLGQAFLNAGLGPERPLMLVSENRLEAALAIMAAHRVGVPVAPVTPAYSAGGGDPDRLGAVLATLRPGMILVDALSRHGGILKALCPPKTRVIGMTESAAEFAGLLATPTGPAFGAAEAGVRPDDVAKIMFTSGSTGTPKGAINTHRMLAANIQALRQAWPFMDGEAPVLVDWLPWNHTFGGNFVFNGVLSTGGSLYIDDGKPLAHLIGRSVANAAEVRPTIHLNAPRGLEMVARILSADPSLAAAFFERLGMVFFSGAGLPTHIREQWRGLIDTYARRPVSFCSAWGATETSPLATSLNFEAPEINCIGVPIPGTVIKLAPMAGRSELRVKGPSVTPGYLNRPDLADGAFDEEGYFRTGDVGRLADPEDPARGLLIEGRIAEDFKLATGVWVNVSGLRSGLLEIFGPTVRDVVLSGPTRNEVAALIFLDVEQGHKLSGTSGDCAALAGHPDIQGHVRAGIERHNRTNAASSRKISRFLIMARPLDQGAGELTEKGTVNQAAVLRREAVTCDALHGLDLGVEA